MALYRRSGAPDFLGTTMTLRVTLSVMLAATCSSAQSAEPSIRLTDIAVAGSQAVPSSDYREAAATAARGGTPVDIALAIAGRFEGSAQHIIQLNEGSESPVSSHVTVLRDGLLDDSIRGQRWDITLERSASGPWRIRNVQLAWRCWRGADTGRFIVVRCP
jgi:hypothetical protein